MSKKNKAPVAVLGTLLLLILLVWRPWGFLLYHGDGKFSDELFFHPRYWVRFPDISLNQPDEHHFRFGGLPSGEMNLVLYVKGAKPGSENRDSLTHLPVTLEAKLTDEKGNVACQATGRPADGNRDGIWVLMSGGETGYWHYQCTTVRVSPFKVYDLTIHVADVGPQTNEVVVTPTLYGGGIELP